ncbi:hypothetical protein [Frigoriglobus tundricola]|uniref:Uncharacterized protein n=1 Tax=Frigoriglobus tundricola TaxID=2774151 RepID=A0A6M5YPX8_9BACT|nr:hypothetical protein [Frigoriglobus tundricola]QJW95406.1 hypothetical protein FTUN_2955 [Frigoriglobus tundricola]
MESKSYLPQSPEPKRPSWAGVALLAAVVGAVCYFAGRGTVIPTPRPVARAPAPDAAWVGVWFKKKDFGDGFELPAVEFRTGSRGLTGRMINPGPEADIGRDVDDLVVGEDDLTFVNTADGRIKYRLVRTGSDSADLQTVSDAGHDLAAYLGKPKGGGTSSHSPERREKALQNLNAPRPPERVGRLVRVTHTPPAAGSGPTTPAGPDDTSHWKLAR